jgi:mono/diheme cytochrome c family protein
VQFVASMSALLLCSVAALSLGGCSKSAPLTAAARGRQVYLSSCITCHNPDPTKPGSQGPEIAGSSRELIEARVLRAAYPPGYTPKRHTKAMIALPHLAAKIDDLTAFLAAAQNGGL